MVPPRRDGLRRHVRMLEGEFDIGEMSLATFIISRSKGTFMTAVPVFPRRLFSQNHIFVHARSGIQKPSDLAGRRVAVWAFQVTMSVLAKGDLKSEYGLDWRDVRWVTEYQEDNADALDGSVSIEVIPPGKTGAQMLISGEVDAYIDPHPPEEILRCEGGVCRLFDDPQAECIRYYRKYGYYPIMHVLAMREELANEFPDLPRALMNMWDDAAAQAHEFYVDFNYTVMPFGRYAFEEQMRMFGHSLWPSGVGVNRSNLERFIGFLEDQQLLRRRPSVDELFHKSVLNT
jgi:4,5-dihydroxyphthalate decarboxylase